MKNNLLFINQNQELIQEFQKAMNLYMVESPFEIDTADSGLDAALLLKKKNYKVVITSLGLSTYDGTKIIEYLNQNFPQTVCIVYTWRLELAHLKLLINERKVFRIFQNPTDYHNMYEAILDAFVKYDRKEADDMDKQDLEKSLKNATLKISELNRVTSIRQWEKQELVKFLYSFLNVFTSDTRAEFSEKEQRQFVRYEKKLLLFLLTNNNNPIENIEDVEQDIYKRFLHPEQQKNINIKVNENLGTLSQSFCTDIHFIIWILLTRFAMLSSVYDIQITIIPVTKERSRMRIESVFPEGVWGVLHEQKTVRIMTSITQSILECFSAKFTQSLSDEKVIYYLEVDHKNQSLQYL